MLLIINEINTNGSRVGGINGTGIYPDLACSPELTEQTKFVSELSQQLVVPDASSGVQVYFRAPQFDVASQQTIRDAFEIEVTDLAGNPLSFPYAAGRDAVYNWTEQLAPIAGPGSSISTDITALVDSSVTVNLAGLTAGTAVLVTARLVNNDADEGTQVILRGFDIVPVLTAAPRGAVGAAARLTQLGSPNVGELTDITGSIRPSYGHTSLNGENDELYTELMVTNMGSQAVTGRLIVAIDHISAIDAAAMHPDGLLPDGRPYWDLTHEMEGRPLQPGASVRSRSIAFKNSGGERFSYRLSTYGRLNQAPSGFISTPLDTIEAGAAYHYAAQAIDPDDQALSYSLIAGPDSLTIDATSGLLSWQTDAASTGAHRVVLRATDPYGLYVEQAFSIDVRESLQNRPPNFVSDPVAEAIASSGFEITTVATGSNPAGVTVIDGFQGPRLVTIDAGDQRISVLAGQNNDRFDDYTNISTGEPKPTNALFDVGYSVDIGFEPFTNTASSNEVLGMDQADLNGDGILDLAVVTRERLGGGSTPYQFDVKWMAGDGDGQFAEPVVIGSITSSQDISPRNLVIADLNNDDHLDLLFTTAFGVSGLHFIAGHGDGTFDAMQSRSFDFDANDGRNYAIVNFRVADMHNDGTLDLVGEYGYFASSNYFPQIAWWRGNGDGTFGDGTINGTHILGAADNFGSAVQTRPYDVGDLNGDGLLDIAWNTDKAFHFALNDGVGGFSPATSIPIANFNATVYWGTTWMRIADFTGDGIQDIAFNQPGSGVLGVLVGNHANPGSSFDWQLGTPLDSKRHAISHYADNYAGSGEVTDLDGDGDLDIVFSEGLQFDGGVTVLRNDGTGVFERIAYPIMDFAGLPPTVNRYNFGYVAGVMTGDYNRDGVIDFSYFTQANTTLRDFTGVGIRLGTRPGEFGTTRSIPNYTGGNFLTSTYLVATGDFNGDGIADLLHQDPFDVSFGLGNGQFADRQPALNLFGPVLNTIGTYDLNHDGLDDIVTLTDGNVVAALSNGNGTFTITYNVFSTVYSYGSGVKFGDFNGDGYLDFVGAASVEQQIDAYLHDANSPGGFIRQPKIDTPYGFNGGNSVGTGDFDGDGWDDLVITDGDSSGAKSVKVLRSNGDGSFAAIDNVLIDNLRSSSDLIPGDFNEDGVLDLLVSTNVDQRIYFGNGDGTLNPRYVAYFTNQVTGQFGTQVVDINGDGHLDIIDRQFSGDQVISIRLGDGRGQFGEIISTDTIRQNPRLSFADLDGDGHLDILTTSAGGGAFAAAPLVFAGVRDGLVDTISMDLNGDGNEEVLAINENNDRVKLFVGDNLDGLTRRNDLLTGRAPRALTTTDLNSDGQLEIITANRAGRSLSVFEGSLTAGYASNEFILGSGLLDVEAGDLNGDGNVDLVALEDFTNALWVYTGNGTTTLGTAVAIPLGDTPSRFTLSDVNSDGKLDAVVVLPNSNRLMILNGDGVGGFDAPVYVDLAGSPSDVQVTDLNADGNMDLVATLPKLNVLSVFYGRGSNQYAKAQQIQVGEEPTRVTLADADEDGRMDLIVANRGDDTVSVIYNRFDPNQVYRYDSDAIDPDNDPITYSIVDGPGGLIINSSTGELLWAASPDQVGEHTVTIAADDGRGGVGTQTFKIDVQPARENAQPLFATESNSTIGANEAFTYQATALDNDNDAVRYRLVDGPDGANIDPTTGLVTWDGRNEALWMGTNGQSGNVTVPSDSSYQSNRITIEGWFNLQATGNYLLFREGNQFGNALQFSRIGSLSQLQLIMNFGAGIQALDYRVSYSMVEGKWTHLGVVIDGDALTVAVYADGVLLGSRAIPAPPNFAGATEFNVGHAGSSPTRAIFDNFRLWNVARSASEIQEGMSQQYDNDARVTLDLRFDGNDTRTVRDFSIYANDGIRVANPFYPQQVPGLTTAGAYDFTIAVEDGRGGYDEQTFTVNVLPELRTSMTGKLFSDLNNNGTQDTGEQSLAGRQLFIDTNDNNYPDPTERTATTDASGNYSFTGLLPGTYDVRVSPVAGFQTPAPTDKAVQLGQSNTYDLAIAQLALGQIRGQLKTEDNTPIPYWNVFADLDGNGVFDEGEPVGSSDAGGNYSIAGLAADDYNIRTSLPAGWADVAGRDGLNVTLAIDQVLSGNDFTLRPTNTTITGGVTFVTSPANSVEARQSFRYAAIAMGLFEEAISYDLPLAPEGMTMDPASGLVAWRPTISQVGEHLIVLRATSASGSIALQDFYIQVSAPNTAPIFSGIGFQPVMATSSSTVPLPDAYAGLTYALDLQAQDAEGHAITFALTNGPTDATLDPVSGALRWTPTNTDVGMAIFEITLTDELGAASSYVLNVQVLNTASSATPFDIAMPRTQIGLGQDYLAQLRGTDALGRPLTWSLSSGPNGLTVSASGLIQWTPGSADFGDQAVALSATSVDGDKENFNFTIQVVGRPSNSTPVINSTPLKSAVIGQQYRYDIVATDADNDSLVYAIVDGPLGMSVHPTLGMLRWTPAVDQRGEFSVTVQVTDPYGETATQEFTVKATRFGGPPVIMSVANSEAAIGTGYLYTVVARDNEGDPLTYRLLAAPAGMTIVETTGEISWTPTSGQLGLQEVVIEVIDGVGGAATQAFVIRVSSGVPNLPPQVTSTAPRFGAVGSAYSYTFQAVDPEATTLTYSLGQAPAGMTINSITGLVTWTPVAGQAAKHVVTLIATDAGGAKAIESFELDVLTANTAPVIVSSPSTTATVGALFTYQVLVNDADLDPITFELVAAPTGATIDAFGKITWKPTLAQLGDNGFIVRASDPRGGDVTQSFTLSVVLDTIAPIVSLLERPSDAHGNHHPWFGDLFKVYAKAIDNVEVASLTLSANGQDVRLDANGTATFPFEEYGFSPIVVTAVAADTSGNITSKTITFDYDIPEGWFGINNEGAPTAEISSPTEAQTVYGMVSIRGSASASDFGAYKLSYRRIDETEFTEIRRSTTAVLNGELGVWDTTMLSNDEYVIRLEVADASGAANVVEHRVGLSGELKLGNFQLSFTDMVIPVAGIPIEITRIYDTLQADREGDFGYGWRLEYRNTDLRVGLPKSGLEDIGIYTPFRPGVKVYLNLPGEGRVGFTFDPEIKVLPGFGGNLVLAKPRFRPDPGVTASLSTGTSGYLFVNEFGELHASGDIPYNPASPDFGGAYTLTTSSGIRYRIDGATGELIQIRNSVNNTILFSEDGIYQGSEVALSFLRDASGRITEILDRAGASIKYGYSAVGNLVTVTDRQANTSSYVYTSNHFLTQFIDPLNREYVRNEYSNNGRLIRQVDSFGESKGIEYDPDNLLVVVTDELGNLTAQEYDNRGLLIASTDALGNVTRREYDTNGNQIRLVEANGAVTTSTFDRFGGMLSRTDAQGNTTYMTYDDYGNQLTKVTPTGLRTSSSYDERGLQTAETNAAGGRTEFALNARGETESLRLPNYTQIGFHYDAGLPTQISDPLGANIAIDYDLFDQPTRIADSTSGLGFNMVYDPNGKLTQLTDSFGAVITYEYDAVGNVTARTDARGNRTQYTYDAADQLIRTTYADGLFEEYKYDAVGRATVKRDRAGFATRYVYDALGRVVAIVEPDLTPADLSDNPRVQYQYDAVGRVTAKTNQLGATTQYFYDLVGNLIREIDPQGGETIRSYDAESRLISVTDPANRKISYTYDALGNQSTCYRPNCYRPNCGRIFVRIVTVGIFGSNEGPVAELL